MNGTLAFETFFNETTEINVIIIGVMSFFNIVIFPFYVYSYNMNRERDEKTVVFPLTNILFQIVQRSYFPFIFCCIYGFGTMVYYDYFDPNRNILLMSTGEFIYIIFAVIAICTAYVLRLTTEIVHFLIFMFALERFFIYFYPSVSISAFHKQIRKNIKYTYGLLVLRDVAVLIGFATQIDLYKLTLFYSSIFLLFNILILISAPLYIPIVIKIRKLKTFRQGFWQTVTVFGFKIISIPILLRFIASGEYAIFVMVKYTLISDVIMIPLTIEVSYLGCNQKTLTALFVDFNLKTFVDTVLNRKPTSVEPSVQNPFEDVNETRF